MSALRNLSVLVSLALFGGACGDSVGPVSNAIAFTHEGAVSGRFVSGAEVPLVSIEGVPAFEEWALAAGSDSLGGVVIGAFRPGPEGRGDLFILQLVTLRAGDFDCAPNAECHGRLLFGLTDQGGLPVPPAEEHYEIVSGQVRLTTAGPNRIAGSFGFEARSEGGTGDETLSVDDGTFDLPLSPVALGQTVVCFGGQATGGSC